MFQEKEKYETRYETNLDLSLYIEGLLNSVEPELNIKNNSEILLKDLLLNDLAPYEAEHSVNTDVEEVQEKNNENVPELPMPPFWGQKPFECLLVKSAGIDLVVPAMLVSYIERINKNIIRLPLESEAFRGIVTLRERSVAIVDLLSLITKNATDNIQLNIDSNFVDYILVIENGSYALACDYVGDFFTLNTEDVRWNTDSFNNPMFAGIVADYLCPIVDIDFIQQQVAEMSFVQSLNNNY